MVGVYTVVAVRFLTVLSLAIQQISFVVLAAAGWLVAMVPLQTVLLPEIQPMRVVGFLFVMDLLLIALSPATQLGMMAAGCILAMASSKTALLPTTQPFVVVGWILAMDLL
jgi:hypothetical protein